MKPHIKLDMTVGTFLNMTVEQVRALQNNVLAEGCWENTPEDFLSLRVDGTGEYVGVWLPNDFFIGIEKDGYTHS